MSVLEAKQDRDNQTLALDANTRVLSISNGNNVTLPNDKQTIRKEGNKLILSNDGGEVELPQPNNTQPYDDSSVVNRISALEEVKYKDKVNVIYPYDGDEILPLSVKKRSGFDKVRGYSYVVPHNGKQLTEPFIEGVFVFDFALEEKDSVTGQTYSSSGTNWSIVKIAQKFDELPNVQEFQLTDTTSIFFKLNFIWDDNNSHAKVELSLFLIRREQEEDSIKEYRHTLTNNEIDSQEQAYISIQVDGVEKGYSKLTLKNTFIGMSNFGYRVYKQDGTNTYTKLETING